MNIFKNVWVLAFLFFCVVLTMLSYAVVDSSEKTITIAAGSSTGFCIFDSQKTSGKIVALRVNVNAVDSGDSITLTLSDEFVNDLEIYQTIDSTFAANTPVQYVVSDSTTTYYVAKSTRLTATFATAQVAASTISAKIIIDTEP